MINLFFKSPSTIAQSTVAIAAPPSTSIVWNDKNTIMMIYFLRHGPVGGIIVECVTSVWPPDVDTDNVTWIMRRWGSCYSIIPLIPGTFISVTLFVSLRLLGCDCCGLSECIQFKSSISLFPMSANLISISAANRSIGSTTGCTVVLGGLLRDCTTSPINRFAALSDTH